MQQIVQQPVHATSPLMPSEGELAELGEIAGKEITEILEGAASEGGSASKILVKPCGIDPATKDFESLSGNATQNGNVQVKELGGGAKAVLRGSSDGRPTIEIQRPSAQRGGL